MDGLLGEGGGKGYVGPPVKLLGGGPGPPWPPLFLRLCRVNLVTQSLWSNMLVWSRAVHLPKETIRIARANGEDSDQPVHSIHLALHTATLCDLFCYLM